MNLETLIFLMHIEKHKRRDTIEFQIEENNLDCEDVAGRDTSE